MVRSLTQWNPYTAPVEDTQGVQHPGGAFTLLASGPPYLRALGAGGARDLGGKAALVWPLGGVQNLGLAQNLGWSRFFELGSFSTIMLPSRSVGMLSFGRIWAEGPSLLRALWAYYHDETGQVKFPSLLSTNQTVPSILRPYRARPVGNSGVSDVAKFNRLVNVRVPAGYNNLWLNLASDVFRHPIGLLLYILDSEEQTLGMFFAEKTVVPSHNWTTDAAGNVIQEAVTGQFDKLVPVKIPSVGLLTGTASVQSPYYSDMPATNVAVGEA